MSCLQGEWVLNRILLLLLCMHMAPAMAGESISFNEESDVPLSDVPMVLTPARLSQPQSLVPASVTVIDRELIEASGAREIYQLMQLVPGMVALKVDGNVPTVSYHGTQARDVRRMLVMIDGRSQYQPGLSRVIWNDLPLEIEDIERIEVTRGPASPAYGANAFQGVINIISRHPNDVEGTSVALRSGNNGVQDWRVSSAAHGDGKAMRITVGDKADDGYDGEYFDDRVEVFKDVQRRDAKRIQTLNLRSAFEVTKDDSIEFLAGGSKSYLQRQGEGADFYTVMDYTDLPDENAEQAFIELVWTHRFNERHELKVQTYAQYTKDETEFAGCFKLPSTSFPGSTPDPFAALYFSQYMRDVFLSTPGDFRDALAVGLTSVLTGAPGAFQPASGAGPLCAGLNLDVQEERYDIEVQDTFYIDEYTRMVIGANLRHDIGKSESYLGGSRDNLSHRVFGNLEIHLADPLYLNFGGYWEEDEINGANFSSRSALIYQFLPTHSLRLVASEALRTVDIYEAYADVHIYPKNLNEPYASDPLGTLGSAKPELFITQQSEGLLQPERIESKEIGYFGRWRGLQWDIRVYKEELTKLVSEALNPFVFEANNDDHVDINGREVQLDWHVADSHLLRLTADHRHTSTSNVIESRIANRDGSSVLWRWDMTERWMFSAARYLGRYYNDSAYERVDAQLGWTAPLAKSEIQIKALVQHDLTDDPVVFDDNVYQTGTRYWVSGMLTF